LDAEIADAVDEEYVVGGAGERVERRFENDAEVLPRAALVNRTRGADARNDLVAAGADDVRRHLVVVVAVPRAVHVGDDGFYPDAAARPRLEIRKFRGVEGVQVTATRRAGTSAVG